MKKTTKKTATTKAAVKRKYVRKAAAAGLKLGTSDDTGLSAGDLMHLSEAHQETLKPILELMTGTECGIKALSGQLAHERKMLWNTIRALRPDLAGWEMTLTEDRKLRLIFEK